MQKKKSLTRLLSLICVVLSMLYAVSAISDNHENSVDIEQDVVYGHKAGMALTYDVLTPAEQNGAAILVMVSGGWFSNWYPPEQFAPFVSYLLDEGFVVIPVRHGSAPRFKVPEAVQDVRQAVRHVRLNAESYGIDPERLGVTGGSAGGHLSLMLALASDQGDAESEDPVARTSNRVAAVVALFPPTDLRGMSGESERFPALEFDAEKEPSVSPILHVSEDDPPVLLIHGDQDRLVSIEHSHNLKAAMDELSLNVELLTIEGAAHGFRGDDRVRVQQATKEFFIAQLAN